MGVGVLYGAYRVATQILSPKVREWTPAGYLAFGWIIGALLFAGWLYSFFVVILPVLSDSLNSILGPLGIPVLGSTIEHYYAVWVENGFYQNFVNSLIVTAGVTTISLTVGTLAGYGLARAGTILAFGF